MINKGMIKANNEEILRQKIVKLALLQLNKKYVHQMQGPNEFDCAGFVWYVYHEVLGIDIFDGGYGLSTTTMIMTNNRGKLNFYNQNDLNKDLSAINKGDILLFHCQSKDDNEPKIDNKYPGHCGIYYIIVNLFIVLERRELLNYQILMIISA